MKYNIVYDDGDASSVTLFDGGKTYNASSDHPNFKVIVEYLRAKGKSADVEHVKNLVDRTVSLSAVFTDLTERVSVKDGHLFFDRAVMDGQLAETIVRFVDKGLKDFKPLVNFLEKLETNPNAHSRQFLYSWLVKHDFTIHEDGDFLAYKGVAITTKGASTSMPVTIFVSKTAGPGVVNGTEYTNARLPNNPGDVVEIPRNIVEHNPSVGCSVGLHAGNLRYARDFASGGILVRVKINPRDVVSVPTDSSYEKMRVCRYRVMDVVGKAATDKVETHKVELTTAKKPVATNYRDMDYKELRAAAKHAGISGLGSNPSADKLRVALYALDYDGKSYNALRSEAKKKGISGLGSNPTRTDLIRAITSQKG